MEGSLSLKSISRPWFSEKKAKKIVIIRLKNFFYFTKRFQEKVLTKLSVTCRFQECIPNTALISSRLVISGFPE